MNSPSKSARALNWDDLRVFLAVCRDGSISRAAQQLRINHSTVLRRIGSLEDTLSTRLFDRLPSGYALTASGNELSDLLSGVSERIESSHRRMMGLDEEIKGVIRVTSTDTLLRPLLMPLLVEFRRLHPAIALQVAVNNTFMSLTRREADVAVRGSNRPPDNLVGRRVGRIRTALYASRHYVKGLGRGATMRDYTFVGPDESLSHLEQAKWLHRHVDSSRIALRVDSLAGMVDAVCAGAGAGMLLCPLADARPELIQLAPPEQALDTEIWILTHPDLKQVARIRAFTQYLFDALSRDPRLAHER